jgi:hypothetical protein
MDADLALPVSGRLAWSEPTVVEHGFLTQFSQIAGKLPALLLLQIGVTCTKTQPPVCTGPH